VWAFGAAQRASGELLLVAVHANRPLEVAVETATVLQMDWLIADCGFSPTDAYCLVSACPEFCACA
jgi:hypothetical protein